jgi:hypothetical protein
MHKFRITSSFVDRALSVNVYCIYGFYRLWNCFWQDRKQWGLSWSIVCERHVALVSMSGQSVPPRNSQTSGDISTGHWSNKCPVNIAAHYLQYHCCTGLFSHPVKLLGRWRVVGPLYGIVVEVSRLVWRTFCFHLQVRRICQAVYLQRASREQRAERDALFRVKILSWLFSVPLGMCQDDTEIIRQPLPSASLSVNCSIIGRCVIWAVTFMRLGGSEPMEHCQHIR